MVVDDFLLMKTGGRCAHCGTDKGVSIHKIIPESKFKSEQWKAGCFRNCVPLCDSCSKEQGENVMPVEWFAQADNEFRDDVRLWYKERRLI